MAARQPLELRVHRARRHHEHAHEERQQHHQHHHRHLGEQQLELLKKVKTMEDLKEVPQVWLFKDGISLQRSNLM